MMWLVVILQATAYKRTLVYGWDVKVTVSFRMCNNLRIIIIVCVSLQLYHSASDRYLCATFEDGVNSVVSLENWYGCTMLIIMCMWFCAPGSFEVERQSREEGPKWGRINNEGHRRWCVQDHASWTKEAQGRGCGSPIMCLWCIILDYTVIIIDCLQVYPEDHVMLKCLLRPEYYVFCAFNALTCRCVHEREVHL